MVRLWLRNIIAETCLTIFYDNRIPFISQRISTMLGLYIHVPFCKKRCHYCSFYSTTYGKKEREFYVDALLAEMAARRTPTPLSSVYFGGGTPSQLDKNELHHIFDALKEYFVLEEGAELTFECNPDDLVPSRENYSNEFPELLSTLGVNRISMGVQSFNDTVLQGINRRHNAKQAYEAIHRIHDAGINNVSIDLIYGLPNQTIDQWKSDVEKAVKLSQEKNTNGTGTLVSHISSYALSIEPGTHLYNLREKGEIFEQDDEILLEMYTYLKNALHQAGFEHYEISNFALPGFRSRHNSSYWHGVPYIGLGPGAHSYDGKNIRRWNLSNLIQYIKDPAQSFEVEHLSHTELYDEFIMTRLRTSEGIPLNQLQEKEVDFLLSQSKKFVTQGLLQIQKDESTNDKYLRLTTEGIFVSDMIMSDLMYGE